MLKINFIDNISDEEIDRLTNIFKFLARPNHWKIVRELINNPGLNQATLCKYLNNSSVPKDLKFLVKERIVLKKSIRIPNSKAKKPRNYYYITDSVIEKIFNDVIENGLKYTQNFGREDL